VAVGIPYLKVKEFILATVQGVVSIEVVDTYGISATTDYFVQVDDTKTVAQAISDLEDLGSLEQGLSQGNVVKEKLILEHIITPGGPAAGDVEKGGLFNFNNATDPYAQGYWIPDIAPTVLNSSGLIDLSNTNVSDFVTFMTSAHTAITVVTKGVRALSALRDALISFRKRRKPLSRKTTEVV